MNDDPAGQKSLKIFLSHKSIDHQTARQIASSLRVKGNVKLSYSGEGSQHGQDYRGWIERELEASEWYILAYTEPFKNWDWCLYEAGYFEASQKAQNNEDFRVICLHPGGDRPKPLEKFDSVSIHNNEKLSSFCEKFVIRVNRQLDTDEVRAQRDSLKKELVAAFRNTIENLYEPNRITITVQDLDALPLNDFSNETIFDGPTDLMSRLFDYYGGSATWAELRHGPATKDKRWVSQIVHSIQNLRKKKPPQPLTGNIELPEHGENFLPVLLTADRLANGSMQCQIMLADGITPRWAGLQKPHVRALLTSIRMTIRFRYDLIDQFSGRVNVKSHQLGYLRFRERMRSLIFDMLTEAEAHGLAHQDIMLPCFESADERSEISEMFRRWGEDVQPRLFRALGMSPDPEVWTQLDDSPLTPEQVQEIEECLASISDMNTRFLDVALERLRLLIRAGEA